MARQPLQVIVIPFRESEEAGYQFAVFHRAEGSMWQFIAGGAEDGETAEQAARREAAEEAGIAGEARFFRLESRASVPRTAFSSAEHWPKDLLVVPERSFAVDATGQELVSSHEHDKVSWLSFEEAARVLTWDSNRVALWELNERLKARQVGSASGTNERDFDHLVASVKQAGAIKRGKMKQGRTKQWRGR